MMIRVADYVMDKLAMAGVRHVFMVSGWGALHLTDAVARSQTLEGISMHHEQSSAFAAVAYAQYANSIGACLVSMGCGAVNAMTGLLSAWQDGVPCVFISGQHYHQETSHFSGIPVRTWGQQEADVISLVSPITKYAVMLTEATSVVHEVEKAIWMAMEGRKGPVWLDIPIDVQGYRIDPDSCEHFISDRSTIVPSKEDINFVKDVLGKATRPVFLIGSGVRAANAVAALKAFVSKHSIPVVNAASATDVLSSELAIGTVGMLGGGRAANFTMQNADVLVVIGCRLSSMTTGPDYDKFAREAKIIVVDIDEVEHSKCTVRIDKFIHSDAKAFLDSVIDLEEVNCKNWMEKCKHWKKIFPRCEKFFFEGKEIDIYFLAKCISDLMPDNAIVITDAGFEELIVPSVIEFNGERRCIHPCSQSVMGFALPAAIGAFYSSGKPIIAVIGDGSIMLNLQELETIRYHKLPIKVIVVENNSYAIIRKRQMELFRQRTIGTDSQNGVSCPDFQRVASAFEIPYTKIASPDKLQEGIAVVMAADGPIICEVTAKHDQDIISVAYAKTSLNRFVRRPLEDQKPFLPRDIFLSEMVIEPIDQ